MNNIIKYKDYKAEIQYSADDNCLYGKVIDIKDCICFKIENPKEAVKVFKDIIDDYLDLCDEIK